MPIQAAHKYPWYLFRPGEFENTCFVPAVFLDRVPNVENTFRRFFLHIRSSEISVYKRWLSTVHKSAYSLKKTSLVNVLKFRAVSLKVIPHIQDSTTTHIEVLDFQQIMWLFHSIVKDKVDHFSNAEDARGMLSVKSSVWLPMLS